MARIGAGSNVCAGPRRGTPPRSLYLGSLNAGNPLVMSKGRCRGTFGNISEHIQILPTVSAFCERLAATFDLLFGDNFPSEGFIKFPERVRRQNPYGHRTEASCTKLAYEMLYEQRSQALPLGKLEEINRIKLTLVAQPARSLGATRDESHNAAVHIASHQRYRIRFWYGQGFFPRLFTFVDG